MDTQTQIQQSLIDEMGLSGLPEEKQEELLAKMTEVVLNRIFVETMDKLIDKDQEAYAELVEKNATPEEAERFLVEKIPGYEEMVSKIINDFKEEMKAEA